MPTITLTTLQTAGNQAGSASSFRIARRDLLSFVTGLASLQRAGVPLLTALHGLEESTPSRTFYQVLREISRAIEEGVSFSEALSRHPASFDPFFVNMVAVGETTGKLDQALERLAEHIEREEDLSSQLRGAAAYPLFSLFISLSIIAFILTVVVPRFMKTFLKAGVPVPVPTRIVLDLSQFVQENFVLIILGLFAAPMILKALKAVPAIRQIADRIKLYFPLAGGLHHKVVLIRFTRSLQILIDSGIPLLEALELVEGVVGNVVFQRCIAEMADSLAHGGKIADFIKDHQLFPAMVHQLMAAGESSGNLGSMLGEMSRFYDKETQRTLKILISLMEPAMIVVLGLVVGGIIIALFLPVFSMVQGFVR